MKRDGIFSWISVNIIKSIYNQVIGVNNILRYDKYNDFLDDNDLVTKAFVEANGGSNDLLLEYMGSDLVDYELTLTTTETIPYPATYIVFINGNEAQAQLNWDRTNNKITGFPDVSPTDAISVYFIGR